MRHSPTAYKYAKPSVHGFYNARTYGRALTESSVSVRSANAFGLRLVERHAFFQDAKITRKAKGHVATLAGSWVLYLPQHERTVLFVGDDPTKLAKLACAYMAQITGVH